MDFLLGLYQKKWTKGSVQMRRKILSNKENNSIFNLNYSDEELAMYFTPTKDDLAKVCRINKDYNKVGYILQKYILKSRGFTTSTFEWDIPQNLLEYICNQIGIDSNVDISNYSRSVRLSDLSYIRYELGYKKFKLTKELKQQAFNIALTNRLEYEMMIDLIYYLRREKIVLPNMNTLQRILWDANREVEDYIYSKIVTQIDDINVLETFLEVQEGRFSDYNRVKNTENRDIEDVKTKIKILEKYNVGVDLSFIPNRKLQSIYDDVVSCTREKLLRFKNENKRLAYLSIYVKLEIERLQNKLITIGREEEKNGHKKIVVTESNIVRVYNRFINEVVLKKEEYKEGVLVSTFLDLVICKTIEGYSKNEKGYFLKSTEIVYISKVEYERFIDDVVIGRYTDEEIRSLIAVSDKLQEISNRKGEGAYYTSNILVAEAHKMLEQYLGIDWKDKYVVWDCASGRGNLTNGYTFKELYCSTLHEEDLKYVEEGLKFQLDFLNDDIEESHKIHSKLVQALKEDNIVFLINPPYLSDSKAIEVEGIRYSIPSTVVGRQMQQEGLGVSSNQLYTQFLMQIINIKHRYNLSNVHIAIFSPIRYIVGERYSNFRGLFLREFDFRAGMTFGANSFNGVYGKWDVSFSIWGSGECKNKNEFLHIQKELDADSKIVTKSIRTLTNTDRVET